MNRIKVICKLHVIFAVINLKYYYSQQFKFMQLTFSGEKCTEAG